MSEPPTTQRRKTRFWLTWPVLLAVLLGGFPLFCCLGSWAVRLLNDPSDEPQLVRHFHKNRADFDDFVVRYRTLAKGESVQCPKSFDLRDMGLGFEHGHYPNVSSEGDCILLRWYWAGPINGDYETYLIHSPRGLDGLPSKYREPNGPDIPTRYRVTPIDENWFYLLEP